MMIIVELFHRQSKIMQTAIFCDGLNDSSCVVTFAFYFSSPNFDDEERLRVLVMMSAQELANGISYSGHMYAMTRAARSLTPTADLQETFGGMDQASVKTVPCDVLQSLRT